MDVGSSERFADLFDRVLTDQPSLDDHRWALMLSTIETHGEWGVEWLCRLVQLTLARLQPAEDLPLRSLVRARDAARELDGAELLFVPTTDVIAEGGLVP